MLWVITTFFLLIVLAVLLFDFVPDFLNWFGRIKIGQITDEAQWLDKVRRVNFKWISKGAPQVPYNENKRLKLVDFIKNYGKVSIVAYWQDAALLKGVSEADENDDLGSKVNTLAYRYVDDITGEWEQEPSRADAAILIYEMLKNKYIDSKAIAPAADFTAQMLKEFYDNFGFIVYNQSAEKIRFVDAVGMTCPFLIKYGVENNKPEFIDIAVEQIAQYRRFGFDAETKLPFHCYDNESKAKLGICGWGRGCGWWMLGLVDSFKELLEASDYEKEKTLLFKLISEALEEAGKYIGENGEVRRMLLNDSLADSSAAAMFAYCYAYMFSLTKKEEYRKSAEKILGYLRSVTRRDGVIDFSQGDTGGIGYYSSSYSVVPAAQGFTAAAAELLNK